ncbi:YigZ family protein [Anaerolineales bacterium]
MSLIYNRPIQELQSSEYVIARSRFISVCNQILSVEQSKELIQEVKKLYPGANHYVYAFRVGYGNSVLEGMSDDGEPSGTSGPPTLSVLRGADLGDIMIVTVRYFGGTKLGKGGLVKAYTTSAQLALQSIKLETSMPQKYIQFKIDYSFYERIKLYIQQFDAEALSESFQESVEIKIKIPQIHLDDFIAISVELLSGDFTYTDLSDLSH